MTNLKSWTGVCIAFILTATLMSGIVVAQEPKTQDAKVFEGTLVGFDQNAKVLKLKSSDDKEMQFTYTDQTELISPEKDGKPVVVTEGTRLRVHYTENEKTNIAMKIEIAESSAEAR